MFDFFAYWIGAFVLLLGGIVVFGLIAAFSMDYIWRIYRRAIGLEELMDAVKQYRARKDKK